MNSLFDSGLLTSSIMEPALEYECSDLPLQGYSNKERTINLEK